MKKKISPSEIFKGGFVVANDRGLHTRPSAELVKCAARFQSEITLIHRKMRVNAKSLLGILMLAACKGSRIKIEADGEDGSAAIKELESLALKNFNVEY